MLTPSYHIEIDNIDRIRWDSLLCEFSDASLHQTWEFAGLLSWTKDIGHVVLKSGDAIVGCCQLKLRHFPFVKAGIADISAGPLCIKKGGQFNPEAFLYLLRKIKEEYGIRRGYMLRISPNVTGEQKEVVRGFLETEGFRVKKIGRPYRTFRIDLSPSLEDLRLNLLQKWRNCLNKAEKNDLKIIEGTSDDLFGIYVGLAEEMCERKKITIGVNYHQYREIQKGLPDALKMRVMVCESSDRPVGAIVCSTIGDTGVYLLGATGETGLRLNSSYLLQWHMIQWLKENGFRYYDLGAFNPQLNPNVYHFKKGLAGKKECEETFLHEFDGYFSLRGRIASAVIIRQVLRSRYSALKDRLGRSKREK